MNTTTTYSPPPVSFEEDVDITWIVQEPVLVTWLDNSSKQQFHLGQPTPTNKAVPLTLWAGQHKDRSLLVIILQLTVHHYVGGRKKSIDLFIVPSKMRIASRDDFSSIRLRDLPDLTRDRIQEANPSLPGEKRVLRLSISQDSSKTIMPIRRASTCSPIQGTAVHIMLLVKSLCEASRLEAYLSYSSYAQEALQGVCHALELSHCRPGFDLRRMYNSNGGAYDLWEQYVGASIARSVCKGDPDPRHPKRKRARGFCSTFTAPSRAAKIQKQKLSTPEQPPPPYNATPLGNNRTCVDEEVDQPESVKILVCESDHSPILRVNCLDVTSLTSDVVPETPLQHVPTLRGDSNANLDAAVQAKSPCVSTSPLSSHRHVVLHQIQRQENHIPFAPDIGLNSQSLPSTSMAEKSGHPALNETAGPILDAPCQSLPSERAPRSVPHFPLDGDFRPIEFCGDIPNALHQSLTRWVYEMRKLDCNMHENPALFFFLMAFGSEVQKGDVARFLSIKAKCTAILLKANPLPITASYAEPAAAISAPRTRTPEQRVQALIRWACGSMIDAEIIMLHDFRVLWQKAEVLTKCNEEHDMMEPVVGQQQLTPLTAAEEDYLLCEAKCIANFCVTFGRILVRYREP